MNYYYEIGTRFAVVMSGAGFVIGLVYLPFLTADLPYLLFDTSLMAGTALVGLKTFNQLKVVKLNREKTSCEGKVNKD